MKIEVWSDYVCPFCYIGKRQLELAIKESGFEGQVEVEFKSFLLDPNTPKHSGRSVYESLSNKYGMSVEEAKKTTASVAARAKEIGLDYNFDEMKEANTVNAHRLAKLAAKHNVEASLNELLMKAYFIEGQDVGDDEVLKQLAAEVRIPEQEVNELFQNNQFIEEVELDIQQASQLGVRGVPFFVFENKYGISGAQPQELFVQTIEKTAKDLGLRKKIEIVGASGANCTDDNCEI